MKKILSTVLLLAMALSLLAGCALVPVDNGEGLENARKYIISYFQGSDKETPVDYTVIGSVPVDGVNYTVTWTTDCEGIVITPQDNGMVLIDVPALATEKVTYTLTATITAPNGKTTDYSLTREIPAAAGVGKTDEDIVNEAYALADGTEMEGTATLTGVVSRIKTPFDPGYSNITVILIVGNLKDKPIECYRMKGDGADTLAPGDTITVSGTLKNYQGTIEFDAGCALTKVVKGPAVSCPATDAEVIAAAKALESGWSLPYKATMTGVVTEITSAFDAKYLNLSVKITVGNENFECYRLVGEDGANIAVGDTITVTGYMMNWKGSVQFGQGCTLDSRVPGEGGSTTDPVGPAPEMEVVDAPVVDVPYKFGMIQPNVSATDVYYISGGMAATYYLATNVNVANALDVYLENAEGGYYMYAMVNGVKTYINTSVSGTHVNAHYESTATTVYTYDAELKTVKFTATVSGEAGEYVFGNKSGTSYTTIGCYNVTGSPYYCQFYAEVVPSDCAHEGGTATCTEKAICDLCGEAYGSLLDHVGGTATCTEKAVCDTCGNAYGNLASHNYVDGACSACGASDPSLALELTIPEALEKADGQNIIVTGTVVKIGTAYSSSHNNISVYIADENGVQLYLYRLKGDVQVGQIIKVTGTMATYSGARQVAAGATFEAVGTHTCTKYSDATCTHLSACVVCGATTGELADHTYVDGICSTCGAVEGLNYTTEAMDIAATTGTMGSDSKSIAWTSTGFTFTNEQASSTTPIRTSDGDHYRVYAASNAIISGNDGAKLSKIVFTCLSADYASILATSANAATGVTAVANGTVVTLTLAENVDSVSFSLTAQARINNIEVTYVK